MALLIRYMPILMISLYFSACTKQNFSALKRFVTSSDQASQNLPLGAVYDAHKQVFLTELAPCITGDPVFVPNRSLELTSQSDYSVDDVMHELEATGMLKFNYLPILEVEGRLTNRMRVTSSDSKVVIFHDIIYNAGSLILKNPRVDESKVDVAALSPDDRLKKCGHGAVTKIQLGAKATIGMEFLLNTQGLSNYVRAVVTGRLVILGARLAEISISLADGYLAQLDNVDVAARVFVEQEGGNEKRFLASLGQNLDSCEIHISDAGAKDFLNNHSFRRCLERFDAVVDYFRNCFQNSISLDAKGQVQGKCNAFETANGGSPPPLIGGTPVMDNEYLSGTLSSQSNLAPLSYTVSDYEDIGLMKLAQKVEPKEEDLEVHRIRESLVKIYLSLEALRNVLDQIERVPNPSHFKIARMNLTADTDIVGLNQRISKVQSIIQDKDHAERGAIAICANASLESCREAKREFDDQLNELMKNDFVKNQYKNL